MSWHRLTDLPSGRRTKYLVLILWLLLATVAAPLAVKLTDIQNNDTLSALPSSAEADRALARAKAAFPGSDQLVAVAIYAHDSGLTGAGQAKADSDRAAFARYAVDARVPPAIPSEDGRALLLSFPLAGSDQDQSRAATQIKQRLQGDAPAGLRTALTGSAGAVDDIFDAFKGMDSTLLLSPAFAGFRFPPDVIVLAVRWYLRCGLSYRDVEELLTERGVQVDHVTIYRRVLRFTPLLADAARPCRHRVGDRWQVDETPRQGRWEVAGRRPRDRPVRPGHRRVRVATPGPQGGSPVLGAGRQRDEGGARRGHHRPGTGRPGRAGGAAADGMASQRAVCQQPRRGRSRQVEGTIATDAWPQAGPQRQSDHRRACRRTERLAGPLRTGG
jgi:MMPL family